MNNQKSTIDTSKFDNVLDSSKTFVDHVSNELLNWSVENVI